MKRRYYAPEREFDVFDDLITPRIAEVEFSYSRRTIIGYCAEGRIAAQQYGRQWVLSRSSLKRFLQWRENRQTIH